MKQLDKEKERRKQKCANSFGQISTNNKMRRERERNVKDSDKNRNTEEKR